MKIKKTELVEWLVDIDNWFSWSLLFIVPGIIVLGCVGDLECYRSHYTFTRR